MIGLYLEFGLLLLCSLFQDTEGSGQGICPAPDTEKFAEYYTDRYVVGTWVRYICDEGYKRKAGTSNIIKCKEQSGIVEWTYEQPPACIGLSPTTKWENSSIGLPISTPPVMEGFCGVPIPKKHTTFKVMKYKVGQQLKVKHWDGSDIITCENADGNGVWSSFNLRHVTDSHWTAGKQNPRLDAATLSIMAVVTMVFVL